MPYARHETFYIRDGWLRKGIRLVQEKGFDFFKDDNTPEELGMGKNMVHSLRFWLQATKLVKETDKKEVVLSDFAKQINQYDPYFEDEGTLWLIHYNLATNKDYSTTWYWFFNVFNHKEFDEDTFLYWLKNYTITEGEQIAESSLKKDLKCFINTYLFEQRFEKDNSPEDNLNCPLRELKLLKKIGPKSYRISPINKLSLDPLIVFYVIKEAQRKNKRGLHTTISTILDEECNAGKIFTLSYEDLIYYLEKLQDENLITVSRTAGLDAVSLADIDSDEILKSYYSRREG